MDDSLSAMDYLDLSLPQETPKPYNTILPDFFEKRPQRIIEVYYAAKSTDSDNC